MGKNALLIDRKYSHKIFYIFLIMNLKDLNHYDNNKQRSRHLLLIKLPLKKLNKFIYDIKYHKDIYLFIYILNKITNKLNFDFLDIIKIKNKK